MILQGPVRQLRRQKQKDEAMKYKEGGVGGRGAGCRLQSNFNEYQGEYPLFFLWGIRLVHRSKSLSHKQGIPIMPLVWLGNCVILWHSHLTSTPALLP